MNFFLKKKKKSGALTVWSKPHHINIATYQEQRY